MCINELLLAATKALAQANIESPRLSAQALLAFVLDMDRLHLLVDVDKDVSLAKQAHFESLLGRLLEGEPLSYLLGEKEFFDLPFYVSKATLIPRPETELLVEEALKLAEKNQTITFLDWGCGTGCIGLTLAVLRPEWRGVIFDKSKEALAIAQKNRDRLKVCANTLLLCADGARLPLKCASLDLFIANPPYIAPRERGQMMPSVLRYEPHEALFSGEDGLKDLFCIIAEAHSVLKPQAHLLLEHGYTQGEAVRTYLSNQGYADIKTLRDLANLERITIARCSKSPQKKTKKRLAIPIDFK